MFRLHHIILGVMVLIISSFAAANVLGDYATDKTYLIYTSIILSVIIEYFIVAKLFDSEAKPALFMSLMTLLASFPVYKIILILLAIAFMMLGMKMPLFLGIIVGILALILVKYVFYGMVFHLNMTKKGIAAIVLSSTFTIVLLNSLAFIS